MELNGTATVLPRETKQMETLAVAMEFIGCISNHFGANAALGARRLRIGMPHLLIEVSKYCLMVEGMGVLLASGRNSSSPKTAKNEETECFENGA